MPTTLKFDRPPVQQVELTVYVDAIDGLQVSHLAHVIHTWQGQFPKTDELPPFPGWQDPSGEVALVSARGKWPFPTLWMGEEQGTRAVRIHHDRLVLAWSFADPAPEGSKYPGYLELKDDLRERFALFAEAVLEGTGQALLPLRIEADYINRVATQEAWTIALRLLGLSDITPVPVGWPTNISYAGLRVHRHPGADHVDGSLTSGLDVDVDEDEPEVSFRIISARSLSADLDMWDGLDKAHDALIAEFLACTGPELQRRWGME